VLCSGIGCWQCGIRVQAELLLKYWVGWSHLEVPLHVTLSISRLLPVHLVQVRLMKYAKTSRLRVEIRIPILYI